MAEFIVRGEFITLGQLTKALNACGSGGQVKDYLANFPPLVNGEPESRRGRKIRVGDLVHFDQLGDIRCISAADHP